MTLSELLGELKRLDVRLRVDSGNLCFDAPSGVMTESLRATLKHHKSELVAALQTGADAEPRIIPRRQSASAAPVSFAQRRMWFLHQLTPDSTLYTMVGAIRLDGTLRVDTLRRTLQEIQRRHEILRTTFVLEGNEPVQRIHEAIDVRLPLLDLTGMSDAERAEEIQKCMAEWARQRFDLASGPLFRARLVRDCDVSHVLFVAFHHIVFDGWSIGIFVRELMALYEAFSRDDASPLPELPIQYADYALWQRQRLTGELLRDQLEYWRSQLTATLPILQLPTDRVRPEVQTFNGARHWILVSPELTRAVAELAVTERATPFMALLTAFAILLSRWSAQKDLVIGSPVANRDRPEIEPLLGFFVNTLALRLRFDRALTFRDALCHVREVCLGAFDHQDTPLELLVEELNPARDPRFNPIYQVMFALQTAPVGSLDLPGLRVTPIELENALAKFDLVLLMSDRDGGLAGVLEYNTDLFDRATIARLGESFKTLLEDVVADPNRRIDDVALLGDAQRTEVCRSGEGVPNVASRDATLAALFAARVAERPDAVAVEDGTTRWTYRELAQKAGQLAGVLQSYGVGPNVPVAVWLERGAPLIGALAGIVQSGGVYVPLDINQPPSRVAIALRDTDTRIVVTAQALVASLPDGPWITVTLEELENASALSPVATTTPGDLACILFTSGSTGRPKGVSLRNSSVVRLVCGSDYLSLDSTTVMAQVATPAFDAATFEIWGALLNGGRLVVIPTAVVVAPKALGAYLQRTGVTTMLLTTALAHQVGREAPSALAGLDTLVFGGEAGDPRWIAAIQSAGGPRRMINAYGPTESTTIASWYEVPPVSAAAASIPIGRPIAGTRLYVIDRAGSLAPFGVVGELCIGGDGLAIGYEASSRLTASAFIPDAFSGESGSRLYRTGDLVRWRNDGTLEFVGRRDNQVKLRGHRIELGEIEAAMAAVPDVGAAVVMIEGDGTERRLAGYVAPMPGAQLDGHAVREGLKRKLPPYMVPASIVVLPHLPLTINGKIDRAALASAAPGQAAAAEVPAGGTIETEIARVWSRVLGVSDVGRHDNFFDRGGHSLLLIRVQAELETALGRAIPLVHLFQYPTIEALARQLDGGPRPLQDSPAATATAGEDRALAVIGMGGRFPDAPDVEAFWAHLRAGRELIRRFSDDQLAAAGVAETVRRDPRYVPARAVLERVDQFDAALFGFTPREAALLDPQQRVLLECAWTALEHAGYAPATPQKYRVGVYAGTSTNTYLGTASRAELAKAGAVQLSLAADKDFVATRLSYKLQLTGPSVTVQSACSTSLVAVHMAAQALLAGECDLALAGGASISHPEGGYIYQPEGILSPDGHCRPFDAQAAGTVGGNGAGFVVLKRLTAAIADGDVIHAVIRGTAINNDGADKVGFTAPSVNGQAAVIRSALAAAGVTPQSIGYVEGHGTATALGDPIEVAALRQVFGDAAGPASCALGSVKGNVGHLDAAAGITGLIKTVLALSHREIPPSLHFSAPNPQIDFGPFFVPTATMAWPTPAGAPRRAGVSSFGIGGTNAHVILEEAPEPAASSPSRPWQIVLAAGHDERATAAAVESINTMLRSTSESLADIAYTSQVGRAPLRIRRAAVGRTPGEVIDAFAMTASVATAAHRPLVWMFPGQGTHVVGMGRELYETEPVFKAAFDTCASILRDHMEGDLVAILYPAAADRESAAARLEDTRWAQAGLVAVEIALSALWRSWGIAPDVVLGHSVGEIAAACAAGVLTPADAMALVATRGQLMSEAPSGAMLAVAVAADRASSLLGSDLWLAAINAPTQCVVAGTIDAIDTLEARLCEQQVTATRLTAAGAFHSGLMTRVTGPLTERAGMLERRRPHCTWISSVTGAALGDIEATDAEYWGRQVAAPVHWARAVEAAREAHPGAVWLEVGPGHALSRLVRPRADETVVQSLDGSDALESTTRALGSLWMAGLSPDWAAYHAGEHRSRVVMPTYAFQRQRHWLMPASAASRESTAALFTRTDDVGAWFYRPFWKEIDAGGPGARSEKRRWLLLADTAGLIERLAAQLTRDGHDVVVVTGGDRFAAMRAGRFEMRWDSPSDYDALFGALQARDALPTEIVHALGVSGSAEIADVQLRCFDTLLSTAAALSRLPFVPIRITVVTDGLYDVTGDETVSPAKALVLGPCRTIPMELRHVECRHVDLVWSSGGDQQTETQAATLDRLSSEILLERADVSVALRGRRRWTQELQPIQVPAEVDGVSRLRKNGVYLVTGGFGAVGMSIAELLARQVSARLVLIGRTPLPSRDEWDRYLEADSDADVARRIQAVRSLETLGAEVLPLSVDVASEDRLREAVDEVHARFGPIHGVIHAAGIPGAGLIARKRVADAAAVLAPKVAGTLALIRTLENEPVDFMLFCSSLTAFLGGTGQVDYCAANNFLDAVAHAQWSRGDRRIVSINWDAWKDEGMAVNAEVPASLSASKGRALGAGMSAAEGQEVFLRALALRTPQLAVCTKDLRALTAAVREQIADRAEAPVGDIPAQPPEKHQRPPLATPYVPPARDVERVVCRAFEDALGIDDVGVHDNFFDLGGHSLAAVDMMARLNRHFGTTVPVAALYDGLTAAVVAMSFDAHGSKRPELVTSDARRHLNTRQAKASKRRHSRMERRQRP